MSRLLVVVMAVASAIALALVGLLSDVSAASVWLSVPPLVVALATLAYVVPTRSKVVVVRQDELELTDLVFFLYNEQGQRVPRDYMLQLHVAVANVGGSKAVVSRVELDSLRDAHDAVVRLPGAKEKHRGSEYRVKTGYRNGHRYFENASLGGPWLLAPGDVITLRFRTRRGVDWSEAWDVPRLKEFHDALERDVFSGTGTVIWREGNRVRTDRFQVRIESEQRAEYAAALRRLTNNFTERPPVTHQRIDIE